MDLRLCLCLLFLTELRLVAVGQTRACPSGQWQCNDGSCVSELRRCDGEGDCPDGSDEMDCDGSLACPPGQFSCVDSVNCLDMSARCDGNKQCPTGYDEEDCEHTFGCLASEWTCSNNMCIAKELRCDGQSDCLDNSDELNCSRCNRGVRCSDGTCLSREKRCDGTVDCADGRDEPATCGRICSINNGGCSHSCADKPRGALCSCPAGYEISSDGATCKDVDECYMPYVPCTHTCINTVGSYYCQCREGFTQSKSSMCLATGNVTRLVTAQKTSLGLLNVRSRHIEVVQFAVFEPVALAFDLARALYYWADGQGSIHKSNGQQTRVIYVGQAGINSLACDWINGQLYWTNQATKTINMQGADGKSYTTVLSTNINPSDLVLLPVESLMFWINTGPGDRVTVEKSWMDGSDRSSLAVLTAEAAHGLTADVAERRLYWISDSKKSIETVNVDGNGRYSFHGVLSQEPALSLAVFERFFYWSDTNGLWQASKNKPNQKKLIWKDPLPLIKVYHELQQPKVSSPCAVARCDLCLLTKSTPGGFTCSCPNSKVLLPDGVCEYPRIIYGTSRSVNFVEFKDKEVTDVELFTTDEGMVSFDVDWYRNWFYWANQTGNVKRNSLTQVMTEIISTSSPVCLIRVDQRNGNLFWVSCDQKSINVITADLRYTQKLYNSQGLIEDMYLDWLRGGILWLEGSHIFTMSMMGGKPVGLLRLGGGAVGKPAFDLRANSLLWNSYSTGLVTMSLVWDRSHIAGKRWGISGSVIFALEPFLLSLSENTMTLWDRRDGRLIKSITVQSQVLGVIGAMKAVDADQNLSPPKLPLVSTSTHPVTGPTCRTPSMLCPRSSVFLCISPSQICNGVIDCPDGFDENNCVKRCASTNDFLCKDRRSCVAQSLVCDGRSHCLDASDEMNCPTLEPPTAPPIVLKCRHGTRLCTDGSACVLFSHVCDGQWDCTDGSDEAGCDALETTTRLLRETKSSTQSTWSSTQPRCRSPSVLCPGSSVCIVQSQFCDGRRDCPDGSDEKCIQRCPYMTDFLCKDRRSCVAQSLVCDGRSHCLDASDEMNCPTLEPTTTPPIVLKCRHGTRLCTDGSACVIFSHVCDGQWDCTDGSDEAGCDGTENLKEEKSACPSPSLQCPESSRCILPTQFCDGKKDCPDGSDESCETTCPDINDFICKDDLSCVSKSLVCNGRSDCRDGSDEFDCGTTAPTSTPSGGRKCPRVSKLCSDGSKCVLLTHVCDGEDDCADGSDEMHCPKSCKQDEFQCGHGKMCIPKSQVCDGKIHCLDHSDEMNCREQTKSCEFHCRDGKRCLPKKFLCDGEKDCEDGSDEKGCDATKITTKSPKKIKPVSEFNPTQPRCSSPSVLCPGSSVCIVQSQFCDRRRDCPDGSDEKCVQRCPYMTDFLCKDRRSCVSQTMVCDGRAHCYDASDEINCPSFSKPISQRTTLKCHYGSRLCTDGSACVTSSHVCDGQWDCADGSDEAGCNAQEINARSPEKMGLSTPVTQPPTQPRCSSPSVLCPGSSVCIVQSQFCDGRRDCPDGSDEKCFKRCPYINDFLCKDRRSCVAQSLVCDGRSHCLDASDEMNCPTLEPTTAPPIVLKCRHGTRLCTDGSACVIFSHVCDGQWDCTDGSDEAGCDDKTLALTTPKDQQRSCPSPSLRCPESSRCILPTQFCDGKKDCPDGSDESCETTCPDINDFICKDDLSCVSKSLVCNGRSDCRDGSDEFDCGTTAPTSTPSGGRKCPRVSKLCSDGSKCVLLTHVCDGEDDCADGSDEMHCPESCKQDEFQCGHGKMCIPKSQVCDGKIHCLDHSDEMNCREQTKSCEFHCRDGKRCLPKKFLCDGEKDCEDGSDEKGCVTASVNVTTSPSCTAPSVLCPGSKVCISQSQLCDEKKDCPDGFDEQGCIVRCKSPSDFLCRDRKKCIPSNKVCDGRANCFDSSDEKRCTTSSSTHSPTSPPIKCRHGLKLCSDGKECVLYSHVCDGQVDCKDGSDEADCETKCKTEEFQCGHGKRCIPKEQVCDGQNDCQDKSDEVNCRSLGEVCHHWCDNNTRCIPNTFLCDGERDCADGSDEKKCALSGLVTCASDQYRCRSGQCVSQALRCDGYADCGDRSDEKDCSRPPRCPTQIRCPNSHQCLQKEWVCDGENDCPDAADEKKCKTAPAYCKEYQWQCGDSQCIPVSWKCDGKKDCKNGKDEDQCEKKCASHLYSCGSGECLNPQEVCNGVTNCADRSDEGPGCNQRNCSSSSAPQCEHHCIRTPNGPRCLCAAGFQARSDLSCVDIDECNSVFSGVCKHICLNTQGSYVCHCHPGFYLEPDNKSCKTKDEPLLLASVQSEMVILGVHSATLRVLSSGKRPVFSMDYHWAKNRIYWLSSNYQSIRWADMSNTKIKGTLIKGVKADLIAVDWVGKNLYWVDGLLGQILAVKLSDVTLKAHDYTVVLGVDLEQPSSLVLVSHKGLMFWSEIGSIPQIVQAGMDGSRRKVVVSRSLSWPVSLAFDDLDNRIYWADEKLRCIGSASMDGDNVKILQLAETPSPFSVAVFNDKVFWSDTKKRSIRSADKRTGKDQKVLVKRPGQPFGLKVMHALSQPSVSNPCEQLPCSHLCLLAPSRRRRSGGTGATKGLTAVCRCPKGLMLSKDNLKCTVPTDSSFVMLLSLQTVYQIHLRSMHNERAGLKKIPDGRVLALPGVSEASSMDASIPGLSLYVADAALGAVDKLKLSNSRSGQALISDGQILKLSEEDSISALAVDWVTSNLYWSSSKRPNLHVTSDRGHTTSLLPGSMKGTTSIAVHPPSGRLCYTVVGLVGSSQGEVSCAWMDGQRKAVLWRKSSVPTSLVFSEEGTVIYWADTGKAVIYTIGVDGSGFDKYNTGPGFLIAFTFIENFMLWMTLDKDVTKLWYSDGVQPKHLWFETKISLIELKAYNNNTQSGNNSCSYNNGGCVHLCLPYPGGHSCRCGQGFSMVSATSCAPFPSCPTDREPCPDGSKCISSSQFCDAHVDCQDGSDEQDCPYSDIRLSGTKSNGSSALKSPLAPVTNGEKNSKVSCDLQCNGRGSCVTEGTVSRCQCADGYKGEFCQEAEKTHSQAALALGLLCVCALVIAAVFIYIKRRELALALSTTREKETLMSNIGLQSEHTDFDTEEIDSPVDGEGLGLTLESLNLKR